MEYDIIFHYVPFWNLNSTNHCYYNVLYRGTGGIPAATGFQTKESAESYVKKLKTKNKT